MDGAQRERLAGGGGSVVTLNVNNAEGGTNGAVVSTANSGGASGTAFTSVNKGVGVAINYDSTQKAHGALSHHFTGPVSTLGTCTFPGAAAATSYATRFYIRFNTLAPTALMRLLPGLGWKLAGAGNNQFAVANDIGTTIFTFAGTITTGVWYRLELEATRGTTTANGYIAARYFLGDATTPVETGYSSNAVNAGTGTFAGNVDFGNITLGTAFDLWIDDIAVADGTITPIGPAGLNQRWLIEDYAETVTQTSAQRRLIEDYAEVVARGGTQRLIESYAEVVTVWQKIRLLTEMYAEVITPAVYPIVVPFEGWGIPI